MLITVQDSQMQNRPGDTPSRFCSLYGAPQLSAILPQHNLCLKRDASHWEQFITVERTWACMFRNDQTDPKLPFIVSALLVHATHRRRAVRTIGQGGQPGHDAAVPGVNGAMVDPAT
jgi:hypothetical protein